MPPAVKTVPIAPIADIDFTGRKRKASSSSITTSSTDESQIVLKRQPIPPPPVDAEANEFLSALAKCQGAKPAILAIVPPYSHNYVPAALHQDFPVVLSDLYKKEYLDCGYYSLLSIAS